MFDKPCTFCPEQAVVWIRLDGGKGEQLRLCPRHNTELMATLLDLEQMQCPECGATIHLEEPEAEEPEPTDAPNEAQTQFEL